jgi:type VI secretion system secreted protein VgrG
MRSGGLALDVDAEDAFDVRSFSLEDGLNRLFSIGIEALCNNPAVDFETIVGKEATFQIQASPELTAMYGERSAPVWKGIVSEIHQTQSEETGLSAYRLVLVPSLWMLTKRTNCRVFQQMSDVDVACAILREWQIDPVLELTRTYKPRKYRVQYQESDFAFVSRLLEAAGVTYFFRRSASGSALVLSDAPESGARRKVVLDHTNDVEARHDHSTGFHASRSIRSGRVTLSDHDHRAPNAPLLAGAQTSTLALEARLEHFRYVPGAFRFGGKGPKDTPAADDRGRSRTDPVEAQRIADQQASAHAARSRRFGFKSNAVDLAAGLILKIAGHPIAEREGELLITTVRIQGTAHTPPRLSCDAVSAAAPYRPEEITPSPSIHGVESATVVGPAGETIHCDEFGRVRVQFHWDRYGKMDEYSSCWVPVNQPWAGDGAGALNLPRIGQEVIVSFLGGNPEEPVIVGRLFTNLLRPPFPLPQNKTQNGFKSASVPATGGYNELMFEDKAGGELIRMRGERDMTTRINRNKDMSIGNDRSTSVERDDREHVMRNQRHTVDGEMMSAVGGNMMGTVGADQIMGVLGNLVSSAGGQRLLQTIGEYVSNALAHRITSETGTTITVGSSMIHIGPDAIVIQSPKVLLNPGEEVAATAAMGGSVGAPSG